MGEVSLGEPSGFVRLARQGWWLFGMLALLAGYVFQAVALDNGKLAVIQPLLVTTIVFALPLGLLLTQQHVNREQVVAAALVVLGLGRGVRKFGHGRWRGGGGHAAALYSLMRPPRTSRGQDRLWCCGSGFVVADRCGFQSRRSSRRALRRR
jgi:hypothetical protein